MAAALPAGIYAEQPKAEHLFTKQRHQPVDRAGKGLLAVSPSHQPRHRQRRDGVSDGLGQKLPGRPSRHLALEKQPLTLIGRTPLQPVNRYPTAARKAFRSPGRTSLQVEGGGYRRADAFDSLGRLDQVQRPGGHRQASGTGVAAQPEMVQSPLGQCLGETFDQRRSQRFKGHGRELFGANLE